MNRNITTRHFMKFIKFDSNRNKFLFLLDALIINTAFVLTTGVILSGYMVHLGASDFMIAMINNSTNYSTILSVISFFIFGHFKNHKNALLAMNFLSRTTIFLISLLPLIIINKNVMLALVCILVVISDVTWGIYRVGWLVWTMDAVSDKDRSSFIYQRMFLAKIFMSVMVIAGGFIIDYFNKGYLGFLIVFFISYLLSISDVIVLKNIDTKVSIQDQKDKNHFDNFFSPLKNKKYRNFLVFNMIFFLVYTMSVSFTPVYTIKYLNLDYKYLSTANTISLISMIFSNKIWSRVQAKKGINFVLAACMLFTAVELIILSFITEKTVALLLLSSLATGVGYGGFQVTVMAYRYDIMPKIGRTIYEGWYYFSFGLGMLFAPLAGKILLNYLSGIGYGGFEHLEFRLLYFVSFLSMVVILILSWHLMLRKNSPVQDTAQNDKSLVTSSR